MSKTRSVLNDFRVGALCLKYFSRIVSGKFLFLYLATTLIPFSLGGSLRGKFFERLKTSRSFALFVLFIRYSLPSSRSGRYGRKPFCKLPKKVSIQPPSHLFAPILPRPSRSRERLGLTILENQGTSVFCSASLLIL